MMPIVLVRGAGDLASGTILKLYQCGIAVVAAECKMPTAIRRKAAFCEAVYENTAVVEGVTARKAQNIDDVKKIIENGEIPLLIDENLDCLSWLKPVAVIDAILAKKNLGTYKHMADITIALGPGFTAGDDVDAVIETMRGHNLGRVIYKGCAIPNTGIPGEIAGETVRRVIHSPETGEITLKSEIGDIVSEGQTLAIIENTPVHATINGVLRGIIREGYLVKKGLKIADIDPRINQKDNCITISDKARCIAGGALEALLHLSHKKGVKLF